MDTKLEVQSTTEQGVDNAQLDLAEKGQASPTTALAVVVSVFAVAATVDQWLARVEGILRAYQGAWGEDDIEHAAKRLPGSAAAWRAILRIVAHPGVKRLEQASTGREMDISLSELAHSVKGAHRRCGAAIEVMCLETISALLADSDATTLSWRQLRAAVDRLGRKVTTTTEDLKALRSLQANVTGIGRIMSSVNEGKVERELVMPLFSKLLQDLQEFVTNS